MALYLPPSGAIYDPPAIIREAGEDLLQPRKAPISLFCPVEVPKASVSFQKAVDSKEEVKKALLTFMVINPNAASTSYMAQAPQQVSITIAAASTSNTATITAVGAKAFIIYQGFSYNTSGSSLQTDEYTMVTLTDTTTVTASRQVGTTGAPTVKCVVIDPTSSLVTATQFGTVTMTAATSATTTITSVSTSLSAVFFLGGKSTSTALNDACYGVTLTNATTVTGSAAASSTGTISFCVVTFATGAIQSLQQFSLTSTTNSTTDTQTITSVTANNAFIAWGGFTTGEAPSGMDRAFTWGTLTNSTTVTYTRVTATAGNRTNFFTVIEFKAGVLNQAVQRGSISLASTTSNTATITSVNTAKAFCNFLNFNTTSTSSSADNQVYHKLVQTDATTLTATRNAAGTLTGIVGYEVVEFI